jgi:tight adherence protein B
VVGALLLAGPIAALIVAAAVVLSPRLLAPALARQRARRLDHQLPAALERLAAALRAGTAPGPAIVELAASTPAPLGDELQGVSRKVEHGALLADALDAWGLRPEASPDIRLASTALALAARTGGAVARPVDRVAATVRERHELQAEVHALATQARASGTVLALAPIGFTVLVSGIEPGVPRFLMGSPVGLACLAGGLALQGTAAAWTARILRSAA